MDIMAGLVARSPGPPSALVDPRIVVASHHCPIRSAPPKDGSEHVWKNQREFGLAGRFSGTPYGPLVGGSLAAGFHMIVAGSLNC